MSIKTSLRQGLLVFFNVVAVFGIVPLVASAAESASDQGVKLEEVIVTAEKRSERLQDVPVPMTALDANTLAERDQNRLQDYFATVPGLSFTSGGGGLQTIALRGVITGFTNPTVGVTIDDVPYGSSSNLGVAQLLYPDIDPSDLAQVEVLRGPQGTLYGANTLGGLIKFVTVDPSTTELTGRAQVLGIDVDHGGLGYGVRGAVNVPLSNSVAIRASGFTRRDPGYIENINTGEHNVNEVGVAGGRVSALWRPSEVFSLKLSAMLQNTNGYGDGQVDVNSLLQPTLGDLRESRMRGTGGYAQRQNLYTATATARLADLEFTSISGYGSTKFYSDGDCSPSFGFFSQLLFGVSGCSSGGGSPLDTKKFTQELRLSSPSRQMFEWLVGAFYTHESTLQDDHFEAANFATGARVGVLGDFPFPTFFTEEALFGDLTVHLTDRFDVQFGGRESQVRQAYYETDIGPLIPLIFGKPSPFVNPPEHSKENSFTYLVTPRLKISPELMVYARFASGYRPGGPNPNASFYNVPTTYSPDKTTNYELGVKEELFDHALTLDASVYYIDWKDIQLILVDPRSGGGYFANGGTAKSEGVELSVQARPVRGLTITVTTSVIDAKLTQNLPPVSPAYGLSGDRLPFSSRFSGSVSADQDIPLTNNLTGFIGGTASYVGGREGPFASSSTSVRPYYPGYGQIDLRAGARFGSWTVNLFANNVGDRRGILQNGTSPYNYVTYTQPRIIGASVSKAF